MLVQQMLRKVKDIAASILGKVHAQDCSVGTAVPDQDGQVRSCFYPDRRKPG